jgi:hypothetical protein
MADAKKSSSTKWLLLILLLAGVYYGQTRYHLSDRMRHWFSDEIGRETTRLIYDTDPSNNRFIIGNLKPAQLKILDRVLMEELQRGQLRLSGSLLRDLARGDQDVINAYDRWRKCCNLMRSSNRVVYPNERNSF